MAVRKLDSLRLLRSQKGQSLMEFCFLLPAIVFLALLLIKVTTVIQMGIVNQQYARAQALFLTYNSAIFPQINLRTNRQMDSKMNSMILVLQENSDSSGGGGSIDNIDATIYPIFWKNLGSEETGKEPELRTKIHVRSTVTMCTQANFIGKNQVIMAYDENSLQANGKNTLGDDPGQFNYCSGDRYL